MEFERDWILYTVNRELIRYTFLTAIILVFFFHSIIATWLGITIYQLYQLLTDYTKEKYNKLLKKYIILDMNEN